MSISQLVIDNIQYIVISGGVIGTVIAMSRVKHKSNKNDMTQFIVKLNRQKESIQKRGKPFGK